MSELSTAERELAVLLVETLNLESVGPDEIEPDTPLFGDGLGLDSIDALELALAISLLATGLVACGGGGGGDTCIGCPAD
ncbi:MAG: hypothetical protein KDI56_11195, partial [Xanthomonadales bacterium]|nr:hypothetical protein [Xanthomonadales bacterium]